jgi:hypothetical protein
VAQGKLRYRCFLPDLTGFTVPPCTGPNYQQSTSQVSTCSMAERGGFEPPVPLLGVHTISSRAPSTARSPLRFAISNTYCARPTPRLAKCLQNVSTGFFGQLKKTKKALSGVSTERNYHGRTQIAKLKSLMRITGLSACSKKLSLFGGL